MIFVPLYPDFGQNIFICEICMKKFGGQEPDPMIPSQPGSGFIFLDADPQHCMSMVLYKKKDQIKKQSSNHNYNIRKHIFLNQHSKFISMLTVENITQDWRSEVMYILVFTLKRPTLIRCDRQRHDRGGPKWGGGQFTWFPRKKILWRSIGEP